jgi:hypothetical protein
LIPHLKHFLNNFFPNRLINQYINIPIAFMRNFNVLQNVIAFSLIIIFLQIDIGKTLIYRTTQIVCLQIILFFIYSLISQHVIKKIYIFAFFILLRHQYRPSKFFVPIRFLNSRFLFNIAIKFI